MVGPKRQTDSTEQAGAVEGGGSKDKIRTAPSAQREYHQAQMPRNALRVQRKSRTKNKEAEEGIPGRLAVTASHRSAFEKTLKCSPFDSQPPQGLLNLGLHPMNKRLSSEFVMMSTKPTGWMSSDHSCATVSACIEHQSVAQSISAGARDVP